MFTFAAAFGLVVLASSRAGAGEGQESPAVQAPATQTTAPPPLAAFEQKKYSGVWLIPHGTGYTGVDFAVTGVQEKRLAGTMTFYYRFQRGSACEGEYPATGYFLKDGRLRVSVDRTVRSDGSESLCGDKPVFLLRVEGPRLESPYLKLSQK